jgi:hypothetical protein
MGKALFGGQVTSHSPPKAAKAKPFAFSPSANTYILYFN